MLYKSLHFTKFCLFLKENAENKSYVLLLYKMETEKFFLWI